MVKNRSRSYCNFILIKDELIIPQDRYISRPSLSDSIVNLIIASSKDIAIDNDFDEMIWDLLGEFPLHG